MNDSDVEQLLAYASEQIPDAKVKDVSSAYEDETYYPVLGFEFEPIRFRYLALTRELWGQKSTIDELTRHMERFDWVHEVLEGGHKLNVLGRPGWFPGTAE